MGIIQTNIIKSLKMIVFSRLLPITLVAAQYADYNLDYDSIDKGFVFTQTNNDDLGNKKNKNKNKPADPVPVYDYGNMFAAENSAKQQLDATLANTYHVNGHTCYTCTGEDYTDCQSRGATAYCEGEQFHCYVQEKRQYGKIKFVAMGCKQDNACYREFNMNDRGYGKSMPDIAGFNFGQVGMNAYRLCFPGDNNVDTSICTQCCKEDNCSDSWKAGSLTTEADWNSNAEHEFDHLNFGF